MTSPGGRLGTTTRLLLAGAAAALIGLPATARLLRPDPRGYGTHTQLGLPACAFYRATGYPCPSCGMTTAFAWATRGRFDRAWRASPAGTLLAAACVPAAAWLIACAVSGRPRWGAGSIDGPVIVVIVVAVATSLAAWTFRLVSLGRVLG